jgi:hypothetical protein
MLFMAILNSEGWSLQSSVSKLFIRLQDLQQKNTLTIIISKQRYDPYTTAFDFWVRLL